jgi:hypothetical protein
MTMPTYSAQEPRARAWATTRDLIHPDGRPNLATPQGQMSKTMEEIAEAQESLEKWILYAPVTDKPIAKHFAAKALALEFGDILVTLAMQAAMQGATLEHCRTLAPGAGRPHTWQFVKDWAHDLTTSINYSAELDSARTDALSEIGALCLAVEDEARIQLSLTGPELLAMALDKIEGRKGEMVGGVWVKNPGM